MNVNIFSVFPLICVVSWATTMAIQYPDCIEGQPNAHCKGTNQSCWDGYDESPYTYMAIGAPMTVALAVLYYNYLFLFNLKSVYILIGYFE